MSYIKNKVKLDSIRVDAALEFEVHQLLEEQVNKLGGTLLHVILRSLVNLVEVKSDTLARVVYVYGALVERDYWKPGEQQRVLQQRKGTRCQVPLLVRPPLAALELQF